MNNDSIGLIANRLKLGVSSCLLGEKVRYDGQHKLDHYIADIISQFADFVPVCPEVECGLPIPREAMHLAGDASAPRLITIRSHVDHTDRMLLWATEKVKKLDDAGLDGFIFKSKSPSSGRYNVKIYGSGGIPVKNGIGLFARRVIEAMPLLPVEEDGRLNDPVLRENFIDKVLTYHRWREYENNDGSPHGLVVFHSRHKYLLMAHSPAGLTAAGRIVAGLSGGTMQAVRREYLLALMRVMENKVTVSKQRNVMQHILGYFKKQLDSFEKQEMLELIDNYAAGICPWLVPVTMLRHYARKYGHEFLIQQYYLNPSLSELRMKYGI